MWNGVDQRRCKFGHDLGLHVAVLELPLVIGLEQHGADQADDGALVGKMPTTSARRLTSFSIPAPFVNSYIGHS